MKETIIEQFLKNFGTHPTIVRSPARINLIGEHTDYNGGFVMPAAIDKAAYIGIARRSEPVVCIYSMDFDEMVTTSMETSYAPTGKWSDYLLGVLHEMQPLIQRSNKYKKSGFNIVIGSDIPIGAGMSSSAAIECAMAYALNTLYSLNLSKIEMALIGQKAEHDFVGVKCGIMDQFASLMGQDNAVISLDCRTMKYEYVPFFQDDFKLVLFDTGIKHSLGTSEYNKRRSECTEVVNAIGQYDRQVVQLRDITLQNLEQHSCSLAYAPYIRAKYVIEENERVQKAGTALHENDIGELGALLYQTHHGLTTYYDVSCTELDFLVQATYVFPQVYGARMMGAGFGGCTINIIKKTGLEQVLYHIPKLYESKFNRSLKVYPVTLSGGTSII